MKIFLKITNLLSAIVLIRFSLSKLFAWPISVNAFIEMAKPIGVDPTAFRLFTGVLISIVCLSYFISFFISLRRVKSMQAIYITLYANLLGIGTMAGALVAEFFLRVEPKWPLVYIALFIIITSLINVRYVFKERYNLSI